jgi:hypothetical protein
VVHPRTEELLGYLERCAAAFQSAFETVTGADQNRRVSESSWTTAEVVHHVALVELQIAKLMNGRLAAADVAELRETEAGSILDCLSEKRIRNRGFKVSASTSVKPESGVDGPTAAALWQEAHRGFEDAVRRSEGIALARITHPHPILGVLDFYQWIVFIGAHELRHADQIHEIAAALQS